MRFLGSRKKFKEDDKEVIRAYRESGDTFYLGILFDRYSHLVFAVSMNYLKDPEESKDAVLAIFEKLATDLKKYEIDNFSHWIFRVTKNHCLKRLKKPVVFRLDEQRDSLHSEQETDEKLTDQLLSYLDEAIAGLNEQQQTCIKLFYIDEKSYQEIQLLTGYNYEQVKSYIQNGKRNLRIYLLKKNEQH